MDSETREWYGESTQSGLVDLTPVTPVEVGNTVTSTSACRHWFGTIPVVVTKKDGSTDSRDSTFFRKKFRKLKIDYIFQKERGKEAGYFHYQTYLYLPRKQRLNWLKNNICEFSHWEDCKNINASKEYCCKDDTRVEGPWLSIPRPRDLYALLEKELNKPLRPWQQSLMDYLIGPVDPRKVRVYVDQNGNTGKTWFVKHMAFYYPHLCTYITTTRNADILTAVNEDTQCVLIDIPRCVSSNDIFPANAIEQLKNGMVTQGKLQKELQSTLIPAVHVVVFTNTYPDKTKLSGDRWEIIQLISVPGENTTELHEEEEEFMVES